MPQFAVRGLAGEKVLEGTIPVYGAKNAALPTMAAALLVHGAVRLTNVPAIADVASMSLLLEGVGARVTPRSDDELHIDAGSVIEGVLHRALAKSLRASVVLTGALLARVGSVRFPHPGGDLIGERPIDLFLAGYQALGAEVREEAGEYVVTAPKGLRGCTYFFSTVSVTATEALMMAATNASAEVVLMNCAMEPEVVALADFLNSAGADVAGAGTPTIHIKPRPLHEPPTYRIIPDRIEAATFIALGACASRSLTITNVDTSHLDAVLDVYARMGAHIRTGDGSITIDGAPLNAVRVRTHEYPGFPTDAHPPTLVALTQAEGQSVMIESIFDGRLAYTSELVRMGAHVEVVSPHRAQVYGPTPLKGARISTPDIRAGLAYVIAAAIAHGDSVIENAHLIDRGYANLDSRLKNIGLDITRT